MSNPFKPDDKVRTKLKGVEVEATVRAIFNDEVQVRTPDGVLRWRTAKTVWPPAGETVPPSPESVPDATAPAVQPTATPVEGVPVTSESHTGDAEASPQPDQVTADQPEPVSPVVEPEVTVDAAEPHAATTPAPLNDTSVVTACGVEPMAKSQGKKRRRK